MTHKTPLISAPATALARTLAELQAIPVRTNATEPAPAEPSCCTGDRRGYQWHVRTGTLPACDASAEANSAYSRAYYERTNGWAGRVGRARQSAA